MIIVDMILRSLMSNGMLGALANYLLNHRYTFRCTRAHLDASSKLILVALGTGILGTLLVYLEANLLGAHYLWVQIVGTFIVFLANFVLRQR